MRRRRAERCVLRAEEALVAGLDDVAREALDEARGLTPGDTPDFEELRARVSARTVVVEPQRTLLNRRVLWPAAAAVLAIGAGLVGAGMYGQRHQPVPVPSAAASPPTETRANPAEAPPAARDAVIAHETVLAVPITSSELVPSTAPNRSADPSTVGPVRVSLASDTLPVPTSGRDALPTVLDATPGTVVAAAPPDPPPPPPPAALPRAGSGAPLESLPSSFAASAPAVPVTEVAASAPAPAEPRIRAVLSAYENAFTSLDASAARSVWPTVDERALSRAFGGLASQSISLGACAINVQGDAATARCTGNARWAPKVGGGARVAARRWDFALEKAGTTWQIVRAEVR